MVNRGFLSLALILALYSLVLFEVGFRQKDRLELEAVELELIKWDMNCLEESYFNMLAHAIVKDFCEDSKIKDENTARYFEEIVEEFLERYKEVKGDWREINVELMKLNDFEGKPDDVKNVSAELKLYSCSAHICAHKLGHLTLSVSGSGTTIKIDGFTFTC